MALAKCHDHWLLLQPSGITTQTPSSVLIIKITILGILDSILTVVFHNRISICPDLLPPMIQIKPFNSNYKAISIKYNSPPVHQRTHSIKWPWRLCINNISNSNSNNSSNNTKCRMSRPNLCSTCHLIRTRFRVRDRWIRCSCLEML